ncbi:hypothetical protein EON65_59055, partial [archaeon]
MRDSNLNQHLYHYLKVSAYAPYLMDYQQQDSQEFLRFLLDGMCEDLCRRKLPESGGGGGDSPPLTST